MYRILSFSRNVVSQYLYSYQYPYPYPCNLALYLLRIGYYLEYLNWVKLDIHTQYEWPSSQIIVPTEIFEKRKRRIAVLNFFDFFLHGAKFLALTKFFLVPNFFSIIFYLCKTKPYYLPSFSSPLSLPQRPVCSLSLMKIDQGDHVVRGCHNIEVEVGE